MAQFEIYYNSALRFLSFRSRSEKEVREYLKGRKSRNKVEEVDQEIIEKIITKLTEQKFLNDFEFAKQWVESRMRFRPRSQKLLAFELKQKGISQDIIEQIFNFQFSTFSEKEQIQKLIEKKIEKYKGLPRQEIFQKLSGFLARRGFDYNTIKISIDDILKKEV